MSDEIENSFRRARNKQHELEVRSNAKKQDEERELTARRKAYSQQNENLFNALRQYKQIFREERIRVVLWAPQSWNKVILFHCFRTSNMPSAVFCVKSKSSGFHVFSFQGDGDFGKLLGKDVPDAAKELLRTIGANEHLAICESIRDSDFTKDLARVTIDAFGYSDSMLSRLFFG